MNSDKSPNLLIISQVIPQSVYAGSILLQRSLKHYPAEKLLILGTSPHPQATILDCRYETLRQPFERLGRTRFSRLARSLSVYGLLPTATISSIRRSLKGFKPDLVLTVAQGQAYYYLAYEFARAERLPLMLLIHDLPELFEAVYGWAKQKQLARNAEIYRYACICLCISQEMRSYLENSYGAKCDVLYPIRSEKLSPRSLIASRTLKQSGALTIGYAGTMAYGRGEQLNNMIPALRKVGARLRIYSGEAWPWNSPDVVTHCGYAPPEQTWSRIKNECDAVILPYIWPDNSEYQALYKTSFPSKLPEYLALGMPVLMVGPEYVAGIKWGLQNSDAALVVTDQNSASWIDALRKLKESETLRETMSRQAITAGERDFNPKAIKDKLMLYLTQARSR